MGTTYLHFTVSQLDILLSFECISYTHAMMPYPQFSSYNWVANTYLWHVMEAIISAVAFKNATRTDLIRNIRIGVNKYHII